MPLLTALLAAIAVANEFASQTGTVDSSDLDGGKVVLAATASLPVTQVWKDFDGFWTSSTTSQNVVQPNDAHTLLAFRYGDVTYATGVNDALLTANGVAITSADWRALPVNAMLSPTPCSADAYLVMLAQLADGVNAGGATPPPFAVPAEGCATGETLAGLLTAGERGLDLGTGLANIPVGTTLTFPFSANGVRIENVGDGEPDLLVTQLADPGASSDVLSLVDAAGEVVGNPVVVAQSATTTIGSWRVDFYYRNGVLRNTGPSIVPNATRSLRFSAFELAEFGIDAANVGRAVALRWQASGSSDPAFFAFNEPSISIPTQVTIENPIPTDQYAFATPLTPALEVGVRDGANELIVGAGTTITVGLAAGSGTLEGALRAVTDASGIARFDDLRVLGVGDQALRFSSASLTPAIAPLACSLDAVGVEPPLTVDVREVSTLEHLVWITVHPESWSSSFVQVAPIDASATEFNDCGAGWRPIGTATDPFTGVYDGGGHAISNLLVRRSTEEVGLFGRTEGASLAGIRLADPSISGEGSANLVGGSSGGWSVERCSVSTSPVGSGRGSRRCRRCHLRPGRLPRGWCGGRRWRDRRWSRRGEPRRGPSLFRGRGGRRGRWGSVRIERGWIGGGEFLGRGGFDPSDVRRGRGCDDGGLEGRTHVR